MGDNKSRRRKKRLGIYLLAGITIIVMFSTAFALFSDTLTREQGLTTGTLDVEHQLFVNDVPTENDSLYIESGVINNIRIEITNVSGLKVRTESYLRIALPENTPIGDVQKLYVYDASLSDQEIQDDLTLSQPTKAIVPSVVSQEVGQPIVLQYVIPASQVPVDTGGIKTIPAKLVLAKTPDITYQGIYGNLSSVVVALQFEHTTDADLANYVPEIENIPLETNVAPTGITLDQSSITITPSMSGVKLTPKIEPANAYDRTVTWASSNESVATVDQNGIVISYATGTTVITATTWNGISATCTVFVE